MLILCGSSMSYMEDQVLVYKAPYGEKASRKSLYSIKDNMFRFWHRFVLENNSLIARGAADLVYQRIAPQISDYMGKVFEEISKQYLWKLLLDGKSPIAFTSLGRWWGNDPIKKTQTEINILGEQDKTGEAQKRGTPCVMQSAPRNKLPARPQEAPQRPTGSRRPPFPRWPHQYNTSWDYSVSGQRI